MILPAEIAFWVLTAIVLLVTVFAPVMKWKRVKAFGIVSLLAVLAFIPSCMGIMATVDSQRFGVFRYDSYSEVDDFRIERYLPTQARDITLDKYFTGHRAKYSISQSELTDYLDGLWDRDGQYSAFARDDLNDGVTVSSDDFEYFFADLGWRPFEAIEYHSPVQSDGGGAFYYFDPSTGTTYHCAAYW